VEVDEEVVTGLGVMEVAVRGSDGLGGSWRIIPAVTTGRERMNKR
jgi:hypothetical protein